MKKEKKVCKVCGTKEARYSCPRCREPYCSVECCRQHKSTQCSGETAPASQPQALTSSLKRSRDEFDEEDHQLSPGLLRQLNDAQWIQSELESDPHLLDAIQFIDTASNRAATLSQMRTSNSTLNTFIDRILIHLGCCTRDENGLVIFTGVTQNQQREQVASLKTSILAEVQTADDDIIDDIDDEEEGEHHQQQEQELSPSPLISIIQDTHAADK